MSTESQKWIGDRCHNCVYYGNEYERELHGDNVCFRDYPRTTITESCRIRPYKGAKRVDAFTPRTRVLHFLQMDKEWEELAMKPVKDRKERKALLDKTIKAHQAQIKKRGNTARLGFGSDFDWDELCGYRIPLDMVKLDAWLGGGFPTGAFTIYGPEGVGKTTLMLKLTARMQEAGYTVCYVDAEHRLDPVWAQELGVKFDDTLVLCQDRVMEDQFNFIEDVVNNDLADIIIYDSLHAGLTRTKLQTKKGKARDLDDDDVASRARLMSEFYSRIAHGLKINQIGFGLVAQMRTTGIGTQWVRETITGGNARKFYDVLTLELRRGPKTENPEGPSGDPIGFPLKISCQKSSISGVREGQTFETMFWHDGALDPAYDLIELGIEQGLIEVGKQSASYTDTKGETHKTRGAKLWRILKHFKETEGLLDDLKLALTGETDAGS